MTDRFTYDDNYISAYELKAPQYDAVDHDHINATRYRKVAENTYAMMRKENVATITCVGDMLCEEKLYKAHCDGENAHFHDIFQFVRPIFKKSDLVIGNLETCVCKNAPYTGEQYKIEGRFHNNAPQAFLNAIREAGFDFLIMANNHSLDCGLRGALETIGRVENAGLMHTGLFRPEETAHYTIAQVNGIRIGVLAYSTWFNRLQDNLTEEGKEKILSIYSPQRVQADIAAARAAGAEFVLVYMHWGVDAEYKSAPSASMKRMAQEVADAGADYIVGSHTHSLMPFGIVPSADGRRVPLIWSMGNFVTSDYNKLSRETGILQIQIEKSGGATYVIRNTFIPCYVPDSLSGISFPVVPAEHPIINENKTLSTGHSHANAVICRGKIPSNPAGMIYTENFEAQDLYRSNLLRQNLVQYGGFHLLLDCFARSPKSVKRSLDNLSQIDLPTSGHYIAVLADPPDSEMQVESVYQELGQIAINSCLDMVLCYGKNAKNLAEEITANSSIIVYYADNIATLSSLLKELVTRDDVVLFSGGPTMALEQVVDKVWGTWFYEEFARYNVASYTTNDKDLYYRVYPDHVTVEAKRSTITDIVIPETFAGLPVTGIEESAFSGTDYTHSVTFHNNLANIRYCAFYKAKNITHVEIPESVQIIDRSAFSTCQKLNSVIIRDGCIHIGYRAFGNCPNLERVDIPATVRQIGSEAFLNCKKLTIYGKQYSFAEQYATENGIPFVATDVMDHSMSETL